MKKLKIVYDYEISEDSWKKIELLLPSPKEKPRKPRKGGAHPKTNFIYIVITIFGATLIRKSIDYPKFEI